MQSLRDTQSMPQPSHATTPACPTCQRPLLSPHLFTSSSAYDTWKVANKKICHGGKKKKATPAKNRRPQSCLLGSSKRPLRSQEDRCSLLSGPRDARAALACLHYATRAAPPDPLLHHQEHDRLWHVSKGAQDCTSIIISSNQHGVGTSLPKNRIQLPFAAIQREDLEDLGSTPCMSLCFAIRSSPTELWQPQVQRICIC